MTYFQGNTAHPQHFSVGAILINEKGEVCCHRFLTKNLRGYWKDEGLDDFYILMRETPNQNESIEQAVHRGLMEEFGATAELVDYVGSIKSSFADNGVAIEKTTVYFRCKLIDQDLSRRSNDDIESTTIVEWQTPEFLIPRMKVQAEKYGRTDVDESAILERFLNRKGA